MEKKYFVGTRLKANKHDLFKLVGDDSAPHEFSTWSEANAYAHICREENRSDVKRETRIFKVLTIEK